MAAKYSQSETYNKMIASELRIGNFVKRIGIVVTCDFMSAANCYSFPKLYQPIPLTEEWLLKFGFKKVKGWGTYEFYSLHTGYLEFQFDKDGLGISIENQNLMLSHIKYVHQLQNLYFALTGEELTINK